MKSGQRHIVHLNSVPLVSVIILTYENHMNIYRTLDSVLMQDYNNIEIVISDDASENFDDKTILRYIEKNKCSNIKNVIVVSNEYNLGTVAHANRIARVSNGDYIKFLACGDAFYKETSIRQLQRFASEIEEDVVTSVSVVCSENLSGEYYTFPNRRRVELIKSNTPMNLYNILVFSNIISAVGTMFRSKFFKETGFDESYRYLEDFPLWLNLTRSNTKIPILDEITVKYAVGGNSSKFGTAYDSKLLRSDMILCYEKEILQYVKQQSFFKREFILYRYKKLKYYEDMALFDKILFQCRYFLFGGYIFAKRILKLLVVGLKRRNYSV